jgi:hypothetical protein
MSERKKLKMVSSSPATSPAVAVAVPDPEVRAVAKRRQFSAAYKLSVLEEADRCSSPDAIGALSSPGTTTSTATPGSAS